MQNLLLEDKIGAESEFVLFNLKEQIYAIESKYVLEITKLLSLENPERLPREVVGILEYGSLFINVTDLRSILDLETQEYSTENQILIVTTEESLMGLVIDNVLDIVKIPLNSIQAPPYTTQNSYTSGICTFNERSVIILGLSSVEARIKESFEKQDFSKSGKSLFPEDDSSKNTLALRTTQLHKRLQMEQLSIYSDSEKSITFKINEETYCLDITKIKNFYRLRTNTKITKIPYAPEFIAGLLNIKGDFITVIDLANYLNQGKTELRESTIVIIVEDNDYMLGILADEIGQRVDIAQELEKNAINDGGSEIISFVKDETVYSFLCTEELFKSKKLYF